MSPLSTSIDTAKIARRLRAAEATGEPIPPLTLSYPDLTVEDAYRVQLENVKARTHRGARVLGHKVGLTSRAMQEMLGVGEPDYGHIFDDIVLASGDALSCKRLIAPRAEPEIAFVLASDLHGGQITAEQVMDSTDHVCPALEIIDSRIADWKIALADTVADNASCARVVLGTQATPIEGLDLAAASVGLHLDGELIEEGAGSAVLGHPAEAVAWLANALAAFGVTLKAGHIVLPGAMTRAVDIAPGSRVEANFGDLGLVEVYCR